MTIRANFKVNIADCGTGLKRIAANTCHNCTLVFGVNSFFHYFLQNPIIELKKDTKFPIELQEDAELNYCTEPT